MTINYKKIASILLASIFLTYILSLDFFLPTANIISDSVYQNHQPPNSEIVIVGMDEKALELYDTMPWPRNIITTAIEQLSEDPEKAPAVIGIDTLYTTESTPEEDAAFIAAVSSAGNVITASNITFGNELVTHEDGSFYMDDYSVLLVEEPFPALKDVSVSGHLNAMLDTDGILRHAIWDVTLENGDTYPSFHQVIYKEYMSYLGRDDLITPPTDSRGRWYVPFTSKPLSYDDGYSIVDLVNGDLDPDLFDGKIVLIGPYALGMNDEYFTSIDHATKMFGVEYQANAIAALINGNVKTEVLDFPQQLLLLIITFVALYWFYDRKMTTATITWLSSSILWVLICLLMWQLDIVLHIFYIPVSLSICYLVSVIINYLKSTIEKRRITNTFKRYVAPQVVSKILETTDAEPILGGSLSEIAVLFADIRGFTPLSEALIPEEVADILNRYLGMMSDCVFAHGGTLDKYIGDCVMAFWGAPLPQKDSAYSATLTAIDIITKAKELEIEIMQKYNRVIQIGIGINYGPAVIGNFGAANRMDYTAVGDTVNIAARLESNAKPGTILISKQVRELLNERIPTKQLDSEIKLKGKSQHVEIYEIDIY